MDLDQKEWVAQKGVHKDAVVLDVRTQEEYDEKHIPNAELLDINDARRFMEGLEQMDKSKAYFISCRSGARSSRACAVMQQYGFSLAFNLLGGILDWKGNTE
jgi:rhodanese-related sulfurtransferase